MSRIIILLFFLVPVSQLHAQGTYGTEFWCAFMENIDPIFNGPPDFVFEIDADVTTNGVVEVPATGLSIPFTAIGGAVTEVQLPDALWYSEGSEFIDNKGIRITTDEPVNINAMHWRVYFSEAARLLSRDELGPNYIVSCYPDFDGATPTEFVIVSTEDDNEIEIIPSTLTQGLHPAGIPFTITLDEGQSYQVKATGDLSGTFISSLSSLDLAVFSGAQQANVGPCTGAADSHLYDQAQPTDQWEDLFHFVPFSGQGQDPVVIVAADDNTSVFFDCELVAQLDAGNVFSSELGQPTIISASGAISVAQLNSSQDCNPSGIGDPNMIQLFPASRQLSEIRISSPDAPPGIPGNYISTHYINLVILTTAIGDITLDGNSISGQFAPFSADPTYSYAQIPLPEGEHIISSSTPFSGTQYGLGDYDAYTSNLGYDQTNPVDLLCLEIEVEGIFCVDSLLSFSALSANGITSWDWDFGDGQTSVLANPEISYNAPGVYLVTLQVVFNDGTAGNASLEIEIFDCPEDPCDPDLDLEIEYTGQPCSGLDFSFSPAGVYQSYDWDFGDGNGSEEANPSYTYAAEGSYQVSLLVTDQYNCEYFTSLTIEVPDCDDPCVGAGDVEMFFVGTPCVDSVLTFYTTYTFDPDDPPFDLQWQFSTGDFFFFQDSVEISFSEPGIYTVDFSAFEFPGCDYVGMLEFEIFDDCDDPCIDQPPLSIFVDGEYCIDSVMIFSAETDADLIEYNWTSDFGLSSSDPSPVWEFDEEGVYTLTISATDIDGCLYEETISFDVKDCEPCQNPPNVLITYAGEICVDAPITFFCTGFFNFDTYNWDFGDGGTSTEEEPVYVFEQPGVYTITCTGVGLDGCPYEASIQLEISSCLDPCLFDYFVDLNADGSLCVDSLIQLGAETDIPQVESYQWIIGEDTLTNYPLDYSLKSEGPIMVVLTIFDENGCSWAGELLLDVDACDPEGSCAVFFPNAFSPNADGLNDSFGPLYENCPPENYRLLIFNRWGAMVYESDNPEEKWDGKIGGKASPSGVYVWKAVYSLEGASKEDYGDLLLVR
ncbi:MAG: PKD domain-containing protein [Bacteroidetes bacterium]|nr:PKD domain-containing protein [Bacteroidota bacterium]